MDAWTWLLFAAMLVVTLAIDLLAYGRRAETVSLRTAGIWSLIWTGVGLGFTLVILQWEGNVAAAEYVTGYLIERSLSLDNVFVFAMIFSYFSVPPQYHPRVLIWGVIGAFVLRALMIVAGIALIEAFSFVFYLFGALLIYTGIKMALHDETEIHPEHNPVLKLTRKIIPISRDYDSHKLITRSETGRRIATPLVAVFVVVATTDLVFAIDSIPAIFAVTRDPFIVIAANAFSLLGMRAAYFMLAGLLVKFVYLQPAIASILVFVGAKMVLEDLVHVPIWASLLAIVSILSVAVLASVHKAARNRRV